MKKTISRHFFLLIPATLFVGVMLSFAAETAPKKADGNVFGTTETSAGEAALMGMFYDFKQTQDHKPTSADYPKTIVQFINNGWDESVLSRFYRSTKPIYATQIWIPSISANEGPKAFGVDKYVKPSQWIIHYKGQVAPPRDGTYRFVGWADDQLVVSVNGKIALVSNHPGVPLPGLSEGEGEPYRNPLRSGHWLDLKANEPVDLDVLVGERPGGGFTALLMVEEKGKTYEMEGGYPLLPIFQVAPYDTPRIGKFHFAKDPDPWKCFQ